MSNNYIPGIRSSSSISGGMKLLCVRNGKKIIYNISTQNKTFDPFSYFENMKVNKLDVIKEEKVQKKVKEEKKEEQKVEKKIKEENAKKKAKKVEEEKVEKKEVKKVEEEKAKKEENKEGPKNAEAKKTEEKIEQKKVEDKVKEDKVEKKVAEKVEDKEVKVEEKIEKVEEKVEEKIIEVVEEKVEKEELNSVCALEECKDQNKEEIITPKPQIKREFTFDVSDTLKGLAQLAMLMPNTGALEKLLKQENKSSSIEIKK